MSSDSDKPQDPLANEEPSSTESADGSDAEETRLAKAESSELAGSVDEEVLADTPEQELAAGQVGVERYVHAAFFAAGILAAYISGKLLLSLWNTLAEWPDAVRSIPFLIEYTEEERGSLTLIVGAVVGVLLILRYYRRPSVRNWAASVASELARVTWPSKDTVTNGTIVVLVAGAIATVYIALLDRLWGYLTNLVYGA